MIKKLFKSISDVLEWLLVLCIYIIILGFLKLKFGIAVVILNFILGGIFSVYIFVRRFKNKDKAELFKLCLNTLIFGYVVFFIYIIGLFLICLEKRNKQVFSIRKIN